MFHLLIVRINERPLISTNPLIVFIDIKMIVNCEKGEDVIAEQFY